MMWNLPCRAGFSPAGPLLLAPISLCLALSGCRSSPGDASPTTLPSPASQASEAAEVSSPPESFFAIVDEEDRDAARSFYGKYVEVFGLPIVASDAVDDEALTRSREIVGHMIAGRPDVIEAMVANKMYLIIIGRDQKYTDMPEYRNHPDPAYVNERVRGTGGRPTSFGEENVLSLALDRYDDESIAVHEFCHTIDGALRSIDPTWRDRRNAAYENAIEKGLHRLAYAASNPGEYWAEIAQAYFDCDRPNNYNHIFVTNREQLQAYDPVGYELCRQTFNLSPEQDWRYAWAQALPTVSEPPAKLEIDPYYERFTNARELPVVSHAASDEALLKVHNTVRKMFAYRHDILKALVDDGVMVVVLAPGENVYDLPEYKALDDNSGVDALTRVQGYRPDMKRLVVSEENVLGDPLAVGVGDAHVVRVLADAVYKVTGFRPVDPNWEDRGRSVQQYELRVQRMDQRFDEEVTALYEEAMSAGKWVGTRAIHDAESYWEAGVLAYFDAMGQAAAPSNAPHPITTRELLQDYDAGLYELVHRTFAFDGRVDWRHAAAQ